MTSGIVFDIREFAIHDGPGIRTTVFMKGCPLRCSWRHNPEGISPEAQVMSSAVGTRTVGRVYSSKELADILNRQAVVLNANEGGVTFSGGEPLQQAPFVAEVMDALDDSIHILLDTSGCGTEESFRMLASRADMVYFDVKLIDGDAHKRFTGRGNEAILRNLRVLGEMNVPFVARVPLVPGVTDTEANLAGIARLVRGMPGLVRVDLLPYNRAAGGKYESVGMPFNPGYDETAGVRYKYGSF